MMGAKRSQDATRVNWRPSSPIESRTREESGSRGSRGSDGRSSSHVVGDRLHLQHDDHRLRFFLRLLYIIYIVTKDVPNWHCSAFTW